MTFSAHGNLLLTASGASHDFGRRIKRVLDLRTVLVVLLDAEDGAPLSENIYGVDYSGRVVWRVQAFEFPHGRSPYTQISAAEGGRVNAYNFSGIMAEVDSRDGRIIRSYLSK
jgi:hypothetical protein